jgi:hypothetical protein
MIVRFVLSASHRKIFATPSLSVMIISLLLTLKYSGVCYNEDRTMNGHYNEQFLSTKLGCYNKSGGILSDDIAHVCA